MSENKSQAHSTADWYSVKKMLLSSTPQAEDFSDWSKDQKKLFDIEPSDESSFAIITTKSTDLVIHPRVNTPLKSLDYGTLIVLLHIPNKSDWALVQTPGSNPEKGWVRIESFQIIPRAAFKLFIEAPETRYLYLNSTERIMAGTSTASL